MSRAFAMHVLLLVCYPQSMQPAAIFLTQGHAFMRQNCDAGHILAHRLGGPGVQPTNIFPQVREFRQGYHVVPDRA